MRSALRLMCFLLAFTVEVKVKASDSHEHKVKTVELQSTEGNHKRGKKVFVNPIDIMQEPEGCMLRASVCAVKSDYDRFQLNVGDTRVMAKKGSIVKRLAHDKVQLVRGAIILTAQEEFVVVTHYGEVHLKKGEQVLVFNEKSKVHFYPIVGELTLHPKIGSSLRLPAGYRNWMGPVVQPGYTDVGVPHAANLQTLMSYWGELTLMSYSEFRVPLEDYRQNWMDAVDKSSQLHKMMIQRHVAAVQEMQQRRRANLKRMRQQQKDVEEMYKRKNFYY